MTGPDHYRKAEELTKKAHEYLGQGDGQQSAAIWVAVAQIHATLPSLPPPRSGRWQLKAAPGPKTFQRQNGEPERAVAAAAAGEVEVLDSRRLGGAWVLDRIWERLSWAPAGRQAQSPPQNGPVEGEETGHAERRQVRHVLGAWCTV